MHHQLEQAIHLQSVRATLHQSNTAMDPQPNIAMHLQPIIAMHPQPNTALLHHPKQAALHQSIKTTPQTACGRSAEGKRGGASKTKSWHPRTIFTRCAAAPTCTSRTGPRGGTATCGRGPTSAESAITGRPLRRRRTFARRTAGDSAARRSCTPIVGRIPGAGTITTSFGRRLRRLVGVERGFWFPGGFSFACSVCFLLSSPQVGVEGGFWFPMVLVLHFPFVGGKRRRLAFLLLSQRILF